MKHKTAIYIVSDGKPGHLSQSRGLAEAIARRVEADVHELGPNEPFDIRELLKSAEAGLVLVAGRRALKRALAIKQASQWPAVVLMNPGWWLRRRFDLCVLPRHDGVAESDKILLTDGALNSITPATAASLDESLLLIGGPSKHHNWETESIAAQLRTLLGRDEALRWSATGSRRTPESTDRLLRQTAEAFGDRFVYTPADETPRGWVAEQLQRCGVCWVSEDSVSMVYEALTAGARVGLLDVPRRASKPGRVVRGVRSLVERGWVTPFHDWRAGEALADDRPPLREADRVADAILNRWPDLCG